VDRLGRPPHMRGADSTAIGRCASRRTRTARGNRSDWWADGAAPELAPAHVRGRGDVWSERSPLDLGRVSSRDRIG